MTSQADNAKDSAPTAAGVYNNDQKVFVGNLSFSVTDQTLDEAFSKVASVKDAHVVTRGRRSLGYGFVVFEDGVDLDKTISELKKLSIGGREINVEAAREIEKDSKDHPPHHFAPRRRPFNKSQATRHSEDQDDESAPAFRGRGSFRRFRGGRPRNTRTTRPSDLPLSETVIFVSNLPFSLKDEELAELFKDFEVSEARVAVSTSYRSTRSRGFGFVTCASHEEQTRILEHFEKNPVVLKDRQLTLKRSYEVQESTPEEEPATEEAA
ncbi:hypothetical protein BB560_001387 [Smittium megazygosporum]|uniref:RRM domain-containing protein n=1 Tax=Smittium megazygosporum TaxID=133381 RepID=A0A2T9ZHR5_9FUNG|nr:hypothetical protein BB560_001387 [Smittium megazygosporum]